MKSLFFLFSFFLSTTSFATSEDYLNSLSQSEGSFLVSVVSTNLNNINQKSTNTFMVRAYPFYIHENHRCRDIMIVKKDTTLSGTVCKDAGDWIFLLD